MKRLLVVLCCFSLLAMKAPKPVIGLQNVGNTCYMNAALQNLINVEPLRRFASAVYDKGYFRNNSWGSNFSHLVHDISESQDASLVPIAFCERVWKSGEEDPSYARGKQSDAQVFIIGFMNKLGEEDLSKENNEFTIKQLFLISLKNTFFENNGSRPGPNDLSFGLNLPILKNGTKITKLEEALSYFCALERVDDDLQKQAFLHTLPPFLIMSFDRNAYGEKK